MLSAVVLKNISHRYGNKVALADVNLTVAPGEIFGWLGPNGGGKSTLFKILSTAMVPSQGTAEILGHDIVKEPASVRSRLGVIFQFPALDKKLKVVENLFAQGSLYGLFGPALKARVEWVLAQLGIADRAFDRVETLSGGLQRRVEIAKSLLHDPQVLIMDEPTAGLDPKARLEVWEQLKKLRNLGGKTILVTTHLLEEADVCDRIGILHRGRVVALGTPQALRAELGHDLVTIKTTNAKEMGDSIAAKFGGVVQIFDGELRWQTSARPAQIAPVFDMFGAAIESIRWGKPTLEDVFIQKTGDRLSAGEIR